MTHSHEEDLKFFGQAISLTGEEPVRELFRYRKSFTWEKHAYQVEAFLDWDENQIFINIHKDNSLVFHQPMLQMELESTEVLGEQIKSIGEQEFESVQAAFKLIRKIKDDPADLKGLGFFLYTKNLWAEAQDLLQRAINKKPDYTEPYQVLSHVFLKIGQPQKAVDLLIRAVYLHPNFADLRNALGWVYLECGNLELAQKEFETAIRINPHYREAHLNLCLTHLQSALLSEQNLALPDHKEALSVLSKMVEQDAELRQIVSRIENWDEVSRQYMILKDKQARQDTAALRAQCELMSIRFMEDRANLSAETMNDFTHWLAGKIEKGNDFPDLRNYLGAFWLFSTFYLIEAAKDQAERQNVSNSTAKRRYKKLEDQLKEIRSTLDEAFKLAQL